MSVGEIYGHRERRRRICERRKRETPHHSLLGVGLLQYPLNVERLRVGLPELMVTRQGGVVSHDPFHFCLGAGRQQTEQHYRERQERQERERKREKEREREREGKKKRHCQNRSIAIYNT